MAFPATFPTTAFATLLGYANGNPPSPDVAVLAAYDLEGYILANVFPNAKYPTGVDLGKILEIASSPEFASAKQAVLDYQAKITAGTRPLSAIFQILLQYGPQIVALVLKIVALASA